MQLQRGTTGFWHVDDPPIPSTDAHQFRIDLFHVARVLGANVVHKPRRGAPVECKFYDALIAIDDTQIRILLNIIHPLMAFCRDWESAGSSPDFVDHPELATAFKQLGRYSVLSLPTLTLPVTKDVTQQLAAAEMEQLDYWKPTRVGDVIFNYWD